MWKCSTPPTSSRWTPTVGVGGQGSHTAPGSPVLGPRCASVRRDAGNAWTLSGFAFLSKDVDLGKKGGYCTGSGWFNGMWQAGPCRAQCPHPTVCGTSQQPGQAAFLHRAKQSQIKKYAGVSSDLLAVRLSFGELSRRGHSSCSHPWPIAVRAGFGMFPHPPGARAGLGVVVRLP